MRLLSILLLWFAIGCGIRPGQSLVLDKTETAHLAAANPNNYGTPVRITGVVTYFDPEWHLLFLQDASGGFFVDFKGSTDLKAGQLIEVSGKLGPSNRGVEDPQFRVLGSSPMPVPQGLPEGDDATQLRLSQWVQVRGTVREASIEDSRLTLTVVEGSRRTKVRFLASNQVRPITFVGAEVEVEGVSAAAEDEKGHTTGIQVFVSSVDQVKLTDGRKLTDPFASKPQPLSTAHDRRLAGKMVHLTGTALEQKPGRVLVIGDGTTKVEAALSDSFQFVRGDDVEFLGFVRASSGPEIEDAIVRIVAPRTPLQEAQIKGTLRTIRDLKSLSVETAAKDIPVDIRGTVTFIDRSWSLLFVQDATAGAYVNVHNGSPDVEAGDVVEVRGFSGPGDYAPIITRPTVTRLGHGPMPKPLTLSLQTLVSGSNDGGWVQITGIVHSISQLHHQHWFKLVVAGNSYAVELPVAENTDAIQNKLLDAQVRIEGVCGAVFNERRQFVGLKFFVPSIRNVEIIEPAPAEALRSVRPIETLLRFDPLNLSTHRTTVRGTVTLRDGEQGFYVQDASAGMYVVTEQTAEVHPGQLVEVTGFTVVDPAGPSLEDAEVHVVDDRSQVTAVQLTSEDVAAGLYRSQVVKVEGRLLERVAGLDEDLLILQTGNMVFRASLQGDKISQDIRRGSVLEVTGILQPEGRANQGSFRIALPASTSVRVIEAASWWTPEHTTRTLTAAIIAILGALLWVSFKAYRVRSYQAEHDLLTSLPNRRSALEYLERQLARAQRERSSLGVILADVDHFKNVNDTYGHQAGDAVLKKIADIFNAALRPYDLVGRYGGEEFLIVVPNCDRSRANEIAERIRMCIMAERFIPTPHAPSFHVTCSFGVAITDGAPASVDSLLAAADRALYAAKNSGRNKVLISEVVGVHGSSSPGKSDAAVVGR